MPSKWKRNRSKADFSWHSPSLSCRRPSRALSSRAIGQSRDRAMGDSRFSGLDLGFEILDFRSQRFGSSAHPALPITEAGKYVTRGVGHRPFPAPRPLGLAFSRLSSRSLRPQTSDSLSCHRHCSSQPFTCCFLIYIYRPRSAVYRPALPRNPCILGPKVDRLSLIAPWVHSCAKTLFFGPAFYHCALCFHAHNRFILHF
jgi:hypothetical protein